jgi:hypothetical protein
MKRCLYVVAVVVLVAFGAFAQESVDLQAEVVSGQNNVWIHVWIAGFDYPQTVDYNDLAYDLEAYLADELETVFGYCQRQVRSIDPFEIPVGYPWALEELKDYLLIERGITPIPFEGVYEPSPYVDVVSVETIRFDPRHGPHIRVIMEDGAIVQLSRRSISRNVETLSLGHMVTIIRLCEGWNATVNEWVPLYDNILDELKAAYEFWLLRMESILEI